MNTKSPDSMDDSLQRLRTQFGAIDIYLFDQLLRGNVRKGMRVLDAGCGSGRNLTYLLREGFEVTAVDAEESNIERLAGLLPKDRLHVARLESLPLPDGAFDVVVCNAVLHFAQDAASFRAMVEELWRVLAPGGLLFTRLASSIGIETAIRPVGNGRFRLPDGSERYLVDEAALLQLTAALGATLVDPIKTTNVQGLRCMTTWVVRAPAT